MPKILVVDKDEGIRRLYSEELSEAGYEVITAEGGYKILAKIEAGRPNLVIVDIKMTDCSGLDIFQDIRNHFYDLPRSTLHMIRDTAFWGKNIKLSIDSIIRRLVKVGARVVYHARRWYVHIAPAFPLGRYYGILFS